MPANITPIVAALAPVQINVATQLRTMCNDHFNAVINTGTGISNGSCCSAVAIAEHPSYDTVNVGNFRFSVVYGNSRIFTGMDPDANNITDPSRFRPALFSSSPLQEHAEQIAILVCESLNLPFYNFGNALNSEHCIYVQLPPCNGCGPWLVARPENWWVFHG